MTEQAAREHYSGLRNVFAEVRLGNVNYVESRTGVGQIIRQDPPAGAQVRRGTQVNIVVARASEGRRGEQEIAVVPDVRGMHLEQAAEAIQDRSKGRLGVGRVTEEHTAQYRPGTVIAQHPSPGSQVPDVRGMSAGRAGATLKEMGLVPVLSNKGESVYRQSPSPGTQVQQGTRVTLVMRVN